jgi:hypothetical protein
MGLIIDAHSLPVSPLRMHSVEAVDHRLDRQYRFVRAPPDLPGIRGGCFET